VVIALEVWMQDRSASSTGGNIMNDDLDIAISRRAARAAGIGHRTHDERPLSWVHNGTLVLEPGPPAVVIENNFRGRTQSATIARSVSGEDRGDEYHGY
jgi:hypothetical protein